MSLELSLKRSNHEHPASTNLQNHYVVDRDAIACPATVVGDLLLSPRSG